MEGVQASAVRPEAFSLAGRRAVVTGASRGIGAAIAVALARAGADVAGISLPGDDAEPTRRAVADLGRDCLLVAGDTGDPRDVERLARGVIERWGGLDVWVNNAARLAVMPVAETSDEQWHGVLSANLHG